MKAGDGAMAMLKSQECVGNTVNLCSNCDADCVEKKGKEAIFSDLCFVSISSLSRVLNETRGSLGALDQII